MPFSHTYRPSTAHAALGSAFYDPVAPARFPQHVIRYRNGKWAARIGLGELNDAEWIRHLGEFEPLPGSLERPLALRYHGHQFRYYNPDLGDGRGFLFAQLYDLCDGRLLDLGTKGSGQTPWSRQGDGRLTLKGGVREVLATSMLEALGVNTSKSLSLIETGEELHRGDEPSPTRSSVLVRLSHSHIRIGSFQRLRALEARDDIERLLDHTIRHYMPQVWREDLADRAVAFLEEVCIRVARTGAQWMLAGFVHGVLNSDNINVTGESFDYGPWRFLPNYDPAHTAAYFDTTGLYAYGRQPEALAWNLTRLAECLLPLADLDRLQAVLLRFETVMQGEMRKALLRRLGLRAVAADAQEAEAVLSSAFWRFMHEAAPPFERTLFDWYGGPAAVERALSSPAAAAYSTPAFAPVRAALDAFESDPDGSLDHPYFSRAEPCTMLIDEVEALWEPIARADDWSRFAEKLDQIEEMAAAYATLPALP